MKLNIIPTTKIAMLCAALCAALFAFNQNAHALTIGDGHEIGFVNFGIPSGDQDRTDYVNHLIGMGLGTQDDFQGQHFTRSNNNFGPLSTAVFDHNGTGTSINLGAVGTYTYLFAKYDGPNYGSEVWYVGDLSGTITIPATAGGYGLSGWTLFTTGGQGVPDGGTTLMLLGMAFGSLGMARRFLKR
jgi:protein with PEP-CTERM/exosortase system signal